MVFIILLTKRLYMGTELQVKMVLQQTACSAFLPIEGGKSCCLFTAESPGDSFHLWSRSESISQYVSYH